MNPHFCAGSPVNLAILRKGFLLQISDGLGEVGGAAEIAPIVLVGAEGKDFLALRGEAQVRGNEGEDAFFGEHGEEAGRDYMDAGEGQGFVRL